MFNESFQVLYPPKKPAKTIKYIYIYIFIYILKTPHIVTKNNTRKEIEISLFQTFPKQIPAFHWKSNNLSPHHYPKKFSRLSVWLRLISPLKISLPTAKQSQRYLFFTSYSTLFFFMLICSGQVTAWLGFGFLLFWLFLDLGFLIGYLQNLKKNEI